jgi:CPA2 family monovalent cation:H+ antiporter-2
VAFVVGAVFAQSSTTLIGSQLREQGEETSRHGRLGLAISVFQDLTAVPFLVVIPVLGLALGAEALAGVLGLAVAKAVLAIALVFVLGRWLLRPLFHLVAERRSAELFTLAVLLVVLLAAWGTDGAGLSLAFGAFLAGMMLGETEFRHQVESSVRPFRDVLLGLFFVGIGMRFDPAALPPIWHWAVLGALLILVSKSLIVAALLRHSGEDRVTAWRGGLLLAVGGEFGLALLVVALDAGVLDERLAQVVISAVLLAMVAGAVLIRFNGPLGRWLAGGPGAGAAPVPELPEAASSLVLIGGYGRVGHTVAVLLRANGVPFLALDTDPRRVAQGRSDGDPVFYGDISDHELLTSIHAGRAALAVITVDQSEVAERAVTVLRSVAPSVPIIARARDLVGSARLLEAGATHAYPEAIEASLRLGATTLEMLAIPAQAVDRTLQGVREGGYRPVLEAEDAPDQAPPPTP